LILSLMALLIFSCNKEKQIQKDLSSKGGIWNIDNYHAKQVSTYEDDNFESNLDNVGTLTFKDDFTGVLTWTYEGEYYTDNFSYSNTEDVIKLAINDGDFRGDYKIIERKKGKITMTATENFTQAAP